MSQQFFFFLFLDLKCPLTLKLFISCSFTRVTLSEKSKNGSMKTDGERDLLNQLQCGAAVLLTACGQLPPQGY